MRFLISVIHDGHDLATPEEMAAVDVFNDRLRVEGHWVFAAGVGHPDTATVVDSREGVAVVTDGPFLDSAEFLSGFWVIDAADQAAALHLAAEGSRACHRKVEVRPLLTPAEPDGG